ncbi:hypothetical protein TrRE_jg888 [Triparma retinervis]|uniref:Zinc-binding loop region of homing endonuclease domain-containing protein n=1 Tax=Triparma retinervis TaxID=2557542 RepID=A0A9W6ZIU3_9STRA|nr:hypothetical protein TrRE_jg888 [Triparma retinervis]
METHHNNISRNHCQTVSDVILPNKAIYRCCPHDPPCITPRRVTVEDVVEDVVDDTPELWSINKEIQEDRGKGTTIKEAHKLSRKHGLSETGLSMFFFRTTPDTLQEYMTTILHVDHGRIDTNEEAMGLLGCSLCIENKTHVPVNNKTAYLRIPGSGVYNVSGANAAFLHNHGHLPQVTSDAPASGRWDLSHLCHNFACFNPEHVRVETHRANNLRTFCCTCAYFIDQTKQPNVMYRLCKCVGPRCMIVRTTNPLSSAASRAMILVNGNLVDKHSAFNFFLVCFIVSFSSSSFTLTK